MPVSPTIRPAGSPQSVESPKNRNCLRCKTTFSSAWSGERVCARCKNSNAWRSGEPPRPRPSGTSRF